MPITKEQLRKTFIELIEINSFYPEDLPVQKYALDRLRHAKNIACVVDDFGNIIASLPGDESRPVLMLNTHMDIPEDTPKVQYKETEAGIEGIGKTILGADPKTGLAVLIELALALASDNPHSHAPVDFVFTRAEEPGLLGAHALDITKVRARVGLVIDEDGPVSIVVTKAPGKVKFDGAFVGKTAHSRDPEHGINALQMAAEAITQAPIGYTDDSKKVLWNLGVLQAGTAVNSTAGRASFLSEMRSFDGDFLQAEAQRIYDLFAKTASDAGGSLEAVRETLYEPYAIEQDDLLLVKMQAIYQKHGLTPSYLETLGASDANILNARGIHCMAIGSGYYHAHQYIERADLNDMQTLAAFLNDFVRA